MRWLSLVLLLAAAWALRRLTTRGTDEMGGSCEKHGGVCVGYGHEGFRETDWLPSTYRRRGVL